MGKKAAATAPFPGKKPPLPLPPTVGPAVKSAPEVSSEVKWGVVGAADPKKGHGATSHRRTAPTTAPTD
eukprot:931645-Amphidinium_carterae.2